MKPESDLTIEEFAEETGTSIATVHRRIKDGSVKSYKLGPQVRRIPRTELDRIRSGEAA